jgi:hypothetical protein
MKMPALRVRKNGAERADGIAASLTLTRRVARVKWSCTASAPEFFAKNARKRISAVDNAMTSL